MDAEIKKSGGEAMKALDQKIAILTPKAKLQRKRPEYGYHSTIVKNPRTAKWVQIDLGGLRFAPSGPARVPMNTLASVADLIPVRFKVEGAANAEFKQPITLVDQPRLIFRIQILPGEF